MVLGLGEDCSGGLWIEVKDVRYAGLGGRIPPNTDCYFIIGAFTRESSGMGNYHEIIFPFSRVGKILIIVALKNVS